MSGRKERHRKSVLCLLLMLLLLLLFGIAERVKNGGQRVPLIIFGCATVHEYVYLYNTHVCMHTAWYVSFSLSLSVSTFGLVFVK